MDPAAVTPAARIRQLRAACRAIVAALDDDACRARFHPELSPLAWHLGHVLFVETYWLREVVLGDAGATADWHGLYFPEHSPKDERGGRLPRRDELLAWTRILALENDRDWPTALASGHRLLADDYLRRFLIQHYAQHLETMRLAVRQARLRERPDGPPELTEPVSPAPPDNPLPAAELAIGGEGPDAVYDNEHPRHRRQVDGCRLGNGPVTEAEWLAFVVDGGYRRPQFWTEAGWQWRNAVGADAPEHWRAHPDGGWYSADPVEPLSPDAPAHGICAHEADAFARWAGARLPHEHEWEAAARHDGLGATGEVWEWCGNDLTPYPGFRAFPYDGYSMPWFDGGHRVLKAASRFSEPEIRRPSFRNFYPEGHRHVLAGLRLARDSDG